MDYNETPTKGNLMTKTQIAKAVASIITGWSTSAVVKEIISNNVAPDKTSDKIAVAIGSYVLGAMASLAAKDWTDEQMDKVIATVKKFQERGEIV